MLKTHVLDNGRPTIFEPCNKFFVKDYCSEVPEIGNNVFQQTPQDNKPGLSVKGRAFMEIMENEFDGKWI